MATDPAPPSRPEAGAAAGRPGVVLVAHGSARSGGSAEPMLELARELAERGFPEVRTAFWREEPFLHQALDAVRSAHVVVLPIFLAEGYFSRVVVPRELGLRYGENRFGGRSVLLLPPLGADPSLDELVLARAREALAGARGAAPTALVILGHGTPRDPGSADAVLASCARIGRRTGRGELARVIPAFLDQDPRLEQVIAETPEPRAVVVPFLVAAGFHGSALGGEARDGREILYAEPIGTHPGMVGVVERLLLAAASFPPADGGAASEGPLATLEPALRERVARAETVGFLEIEIRSAGVERYTLRHARDAGAQDSELRRLDDADALTAFARRAPDGAHRPLRTAADLAGGWRYEADGIRALVEALVALYGPAVVHWHLGARGALPVEEFAEVAARHTGAYEALRRVDATSLAQGIRRVCDGLPCLRARLWGPATDPATGHGKGAGLVVPCPAPCPILLGALVSPTPE